ncbi:MAG: hypothetical protein BGO58_12175 [Sphingopyxis sp. 65-8]|nr:hypothetical protein [Sphingopyxis terrae]OJW23802.1 MAG: hypothetical protein BGO58_12175 [Sphingopyxis sp. 65-8]
MTIHKDAASFEAALRLCASCADGFTALFLSVDGILPHLLLVRASNTFLFGTFGRLLLRNSLALRGHLALQFKTPAVLPGHLGAQRRDLDFDAGIEVDRTPAVPGAALTGSLLILDIRKPLLCLGRARCVRIAPA